MLFQADVQEGGNAQRAGLVGKVSTHLELLTQLVHA